MIVFKRSKSILYLLLLPFLSLHTLPHFSTPRLFESINNYNKNALHCGYNYATANRGFDAQGIETSFLDVYGRHKMHKIALNSFTGLMVPKEVDVLDPLNRYGGTLTVFTNLVPAEGSGDLLFNGNFSVQSAFFYGRYYPFKRFFIELETGARILKVGALEYTDLTPEEAIAGFTKDDPAWANFLTLFDEILGLFKLSKKAIKTHGASDTKLGFGYHYKEAVNESTDCSFIPKIGVLIPSGKERDQNHVFSFPLGYDKHPGFLLGLYTELSFTHCTIGVNGELLFLQPRTKNMRLKTSTEQSGLFLVGRGDAKVSPGRVSHLYSFLQIHNEDRNYSLSFGYRYGEQEETTVYPLNQTLFNAKIVNSYEAFRKWKSHILHADIHFNYLTFAIDYPVQGIYSLRTKAGSTKLSISIGKEF